MELCLGTVQFGMDYGVQGAPRQAYGDIDRMIEYGLLHGITWFDTAKAYGEAERVLGHYLKHRKVKEAHIISKLPANGFEGYSKERWGEIACRHAKKSMEDLGISKLEAYLFHNAAHIYNRDAVEALYQVKRQGLTEKIGVSIYTPEEALKALDYEEVEVVQIPYNLFDHRLDHSGFFEKAKERGVTVYARSSLLQGLALMDPEDLPPNMNFAKRYLKSFLRICKKYQASPLEAATGYLDYRGGIDYVVFGADSLEQLKEYICVKSRTIPEPMYRELKFEFENVEEKLVNPGMW